MSFSLITLLITISGISFRHLHTRRIENHKRQLPVERMKMYSKLVSATAACTSPLGLLTLPLKHHPPLSRRTQRRRQLSCCQRQIFGIVGLLISTKMIFAHCRSRRQGSRCLLRLPSWSSVTAAHKASWHGLASRKVQAGERSIH